MNKFTEAKKGYKFVPSEKADERIIAKFRPEHKLFKQYQHNVPESWVTKGLVEEVAE